MPLHATVRTKTSRAAVLAVCLAGLLTAGCGEPADAGGGPAEAKKRQASPAASASPSPSPTPTPTPTPSPTLPFPDDGEDVQACADGTCEIRVAKSDMMPLPKGWGIGRLEVIAVNAEAVQMVGTLTASDFSSNGLCGATFVGPSANGPGQAILNCHVGEKPVINKMELEVLGILDGKAVLSVRPAS
jgi:hypothetical protein